jgi:hypothetical protein
MHYKLLVIIQFWVPIKKKKTKYKKKTKKYIAVRRRHKGAQKMAKDWLRKFKNTKIEI